MATDPALTPLNPDQLLAKLIEMEGVIKQQKVALNALNDERNGLKSERDHFKGAFEEADAERQRLELVIRQLLRAQFGRKSERLDPAQFQLTLENLEQEIAAAKAARQDAADSDGNRRPRRAPARRNHLPAHLERDEVVIEPADRSCPCCGGALHPIGVEETERLDAVPLRLRVTRRPIYGCRSCAEVQAPAPDSAIPGGLPTEALLAQVAVSKYNCRCTARSWSATASTSTAPPLDGAWWLKPLWELLLGSVLSSPKLFCDDTRLPVLAPGKGKTSTGYLSPGMTTLGRATCRRRTSTPRTGSAPARCWPTTPAYCRAGAASSG
jgi:transposase